MSLSTSQIDALIDAVRRTAKTEILPYFRALDDSDVEIKTHAQDLVTKADRASERALTAAAREIFPDALVLGEEAVSEGAINVDALRDAPLSVIIDPIDGTWNYANGLGMFGVILAVVANGETVFGLLYDPLGDDWVTAEAAGGAWFRKSDGAARRLSVGAAVPVEEMTGYWPPTLFDRTQKDALLDFSKTIYRHSSLRCACHEYRLFAQGGADFMVTGNLNPWDHAAGALIAREAGGYLKMLDGTPYRPTMTTGNLLVAKDRDSWNALAEPLKTAIFGV
mgnify:CR=1 FL=1